MSASTGWTCPACGTRNEPDASECASCGRWASVFDLERVEPVTARAAGPEPPMYEPDYEQPYEPVEGLPEPVPLPPADEPEPGQRPRSARWVVWAIVTAVVLASWILDAVRG